MRVKDGLTLGESVDALTAVAPARHGTGPAVKQPVVHRPVTRVSPIHTRHSFARIETHTKKKKLTGGWCVGRKTRVFVLVLFTGQDTQTGDE